jgi:hypothetical protein
MVLFDYSYILKAQFNCVAGWGNVSVQAKSLSLVKGDEGVAVKDD